jgi:hypothetical protein
MLGSALPTEGFASVLSPSSCNPLDLSRYIHQPKGSVNDDNEGHQWFWAHPSVSRYAEFPLSLGR